MNALMHWDSAANRWMAVITLPGGVKHELPLDDWMQAAAANQAVPWRQSSAQAGTEASLIIR